MKLHFSKQEIDEIIARPEAEPVESAEAQRRRRTQDFDPPSSSHYATMRRRLVDTISNSADPSEPDRLGSGSDADGILRGPNKFLELMDVIYFWALGEAYLQHPQMQSDMRLAAVQPQFLAIVLKSPVLGHGCQTSEEYHTCILGFAKPCPILTFTFRLGSM